MKLEELIGCLNKYIMMKYYFKLRRVDMLVTR